MQACELQSEYSCVVGVSSIHSVLRHGVLIVCTLQHAGQLPGILHYTIWVLNPPEPFQPILPNTVDSNFSDKFLQLLSELETCSIMQKDNSTYAVLHLALSSSPGLVNFFFAVYGCRKRGEISRSPCTQEIAIKYRRSLIMYRVRHRERRTRGKIVSGKKMQFIC